MLEWSQYWYDGRGERMNEPFFDVQNDIDVRVFVLVVDDGQETTILDAYAYISLYNILP